jgi:type I restriction enzyme M protein
MPKLTQQELETYLWGAATILRGKTAGQDYKTYILTLLFFKRLSDQWDYEAYEVIREKEAEFGRTLNEKQRQALRATAHVHRFKIPEGAHWNDVLSVSENIGEVLTKATRDIAKANPELTGVFTVDWNQPAPDGNDKLIRNAVVHALIQHFNTKNLSNANVEPDILGRAYEYLIKMFADDAGAKAGEFFTPPEVVDILIRCLEPKTGETIYDPTCGSGGMLVHSADFLNEHGHKANLIQCFGQEQNWQTYSIAKINMILHGLDAQIKGGKSTITEPQFLDAKGGVQQFDMVIANFPFSNELWWLPEELQTEEEAKKQKKSIGKDGFTDPFNRFTFATPPLSNGDFAFIQHIIASTKDDGRCGVVCPQGVLFRGQPEIEEETGEFDKNGEPKIRRRKADDEYLIRKGILDSRYLDAVIGLPLNIFYGAGVPACLLLMNKNRPEERRDKVLLIYAARHYRELSNKNQLRPQDVMRILVHYHTYGDAEKAGALAKAHCERLQAEVTRIETEEVARITVEYEPAAKKADELQKQIADMTTRLATAAKSDRKKLEADQRKLQAALDRPLKELAKRDEEIAAARRKAAEDHQALVDTADELVKLYADPSELVKHARVVGIEEIEENEHNLNIPRYVDTFEPEEPIDVQDAIQKLRKAKEAADGALNALMAQLAEIGYAR